MTKRQYLSFVPVSCTHLRILIALPADWAFIEQIPLVMEISPTIVDFVGQKSCETPVNAVSLHSQSSILYGGGRMIGRCAPNRICADAMHQRALIELNSRTVMLEITIAAMTKAQTSKV